MPELLGQTLFAAALVASQAGLIELGAAVPQILVALAIIGATIILVKLVMQAAAWLAARRRNGQPGGKPDNPGCDSPGHCASAPEPQYLATDTGRFVLPLDATELRKMANNLETIAQQQPATQGHVERIEAKVDAQGLKLDTLGTKLDEHIAANGDRP
jgi:hypothetical protein